MKRNKGFTLIELLVVMAIIAILASIVVPNVQRYIVRARLTKAVAEIGGMDMALTAICTDAGRGNLGQMFIPQNVSVLNGGFWPTDITAFNDPYNSSALFTQASNIYSEVAYNLLRLGRDCLRSDTVPTPIAGLYISPDILSKLGTAYMDIGLDPWGGSYKVFPGPWRFSREGLATGRWPIPFRSYTVETNSSSGVSFAVLNDAYNLYQADVQAMGVEDWQTWPPIMSYPADGNKPVYIWSYGANARSSQMMYRAVYDLANKWDWWAPDFEPADLGGGDDINNWDKATSWQRFYM